MYNQREKIGGKRGVDASEAFFHKNGDDQHASEKDWKKYGDKNYKWSQLQKNQSYQKIREDEDQN